MTIFLLAVFEARIELAQRILNYKLDKKILSQRDLFGNNALHLAVMSNSLDMVSFILNENLSLDSKNSVS